MDYELNETKYRKYLYETQQKIKLRHQKLLQVIENLKKKGVQLSSDFPNIEFKAIILDEFGDIPPSPAAENENKKSNEAVGREKDAIKTNQWTEMKEPVFDEAELSDIGRLIVEAYNKGVTIKLPKVIKTPQNSDKNRSVMLQTPASGDGFMVKPVSKLLPMQSNSRYRHRLRAAMVETSSPDLKTDSALDYQMKSPKSRLPLRSLSAYKNKEDKPAETINQNLIKVPTYVPSPTNKAMSVLDSPEEPELENFKSTDMPTNIVKTPESPELSEHLLNFIKRMQANKNLMSKPSDE